MASNSRSILLQGLFNLLVDIAVALPVLILFLVGKPSVRGFFCDDESIRRPYQDSTVGNVVLYVYGFSLPLVFIVIVEFIGRSLVPKIGPVKIGSCQVPSIVVNIYFLYIGCLFGSAMSQCITDICKYTIGRLRPHFIEVCNPDFSLLNCTGSDGQPKYVTNYTCRGNPGLFDGDDQEAQDRIHDGRQSFLSGHASFSFQASVFVVLYLQARASVFIRKRERYLFVPFFQFLVVAVATYISVTRVMDNKHHPGDVIAGAILGTIVQVLNCVYVLRLFDKDSDVDSYVPVEANLNVVRVAESGNVTSSARVAKNVVSNDEAV